MECIGNNKKRMHKGLNALKAVKYEKELKEYI